MMKLGIFVGERGLWTFFKEIYADFNEHYETTVFTAKEYQLPFFSERVNRLAYRRGMRSIIEQSDVCFFEWASELLEFASHMPKTTPIITRLHSFELADWAHRIHWDHVDKIIFVSDAIRQKFIAQYPDQASKAVLVYNAISVSKFKPVSRPFDFSLGMLCAINPIKRVYEAILVLKELRDQGHNVSLHIAGAPNQGNYQNRYYVAVRRLVEKLDLEDAVIFHGHINNPETWLQNIDIFISNSFWEGLQTALIEAMASGCYCVSHFWDGAEEVLPANNVYTTNSDLIQKLVDYAQLSNDERTKLKNKMVEITRQKFDIEDKKALLREIIESV